MNINIPQMIKKYGSKFLKNPNAPLNLKIDKVTKGDGKGTAKTVKTKDGFKLGKFSLQSKARLLVNIIQQLNPNRTRWDGEYLVYLLTYHTDSNSRLGVY